ncbi:MAG: M15 family metallopeptidase [Treponema sp.]|nr:M15 family metallopeptidase [Treponema sp.]
MKKANKRLFSFIFLIVSISTVYAQNATEDTLTTNLIQKQKMLISELKYFRLAYPDIEFSQQFDKEQNDWIITVKTPTSKKNTSKTTDFYWANGSFLPKEELENSENYWPLLYSYPKELKDPVEYTEEERLQIKEYGSKESRKNGAGTPMFLFDEIYDSYTRGKLEQQLKRITFLEKNTTIHKRIEAPLKKVEEKIYAQKEDAEIKAFLENIKSVDGYNWRIIEGTKRKSFHSLGIAIDILTKKQGGKQIFWNWARSKYPNTWMLVPLKDRWMPPQKVIQIFEEEGFIWGGKWVIYDNMHFEYHPELIQYNYHD